jgi:hypothetical protein
LYLRVCVEQIVLRLSVEHNRLVLIPKVPRILRSADISPNNQIDKHTVLGHERQLPWQVTRKRHQVKRAGWLQNPKTFSNPRRAPLLVITFSIGICLCAIQLAHIKGWVSKIISTHASGNTLSSRKTSA